MKQFGKAGLGFLLLLASFFVSAQTKFTVNGYVKDSASGESIVGATVVIDGKSVGSNQYGFYSITLDSGEYDLTVSHVSYLSQSQRISLSQNLQQNIFLLPKAAALSEVIVYNRRRDVNVRAAQMGQIDLSVNQIKNIPAFLGEVDILKAIQLLPGVRNAGEGNAGFYVRGGGPDQNLIMLDEAVVYNTGHLFGFFSIFNSDAIKNTSLIKGGMPAQYGGRLSSVLDVQMKDGNSNRFVTEGGIGLIASRFSVQGPIKKDKASFIVSGRRTYVDALVKPFIKKTSNFYGSGYYFYDLNAKINYRFSDKDRLFLSGYFGRDVFAFHNAKLEFKADIPWGNSTATLRWNHVFNRKLFANTTLVYNDYNFSFGAAQNNFQIKLASGIRDGSGKIDFDYYPSGAHKIKFGGLATYHKFTPNVTSGRQDSIIFKPSNAAVKHAIENALYVQDDWDLSEKLKLNYGLRWSSFTQVGPYTKYVTDANQNKLDSTVYRDFQPVKTYNGFEPRATARYAVNSTTSIKASVTRNLQYIHLVSNAGTTLPTDLWVPSTFRVAPQKSWQYAAGLFKNFRNNEYETSVEAYYKTMQNQIEYREGYTPSLIDPEEEFVFGKGWSYGTEWFVNKVRGRLTGWIGYTLSWTWRKFPQLNNGETYPAKYDRRHDLSVVATYEHSKKWKFGAVFVFATGNATSLPQRFYIINGVLTQEYSQINAYRLPSYHRLDLSATYTPQPKKQKRLQSFWVFSVYNAYSRANPYFIYFSQEGSAFNGTLKVQAKQVSLFPVLPSVTWNFRF
ncbi:TonB-dependent receptor [Flavisolibacter ginsenosidimutans]|uniref:TonB-dependent receptor n=1 Tax=Flavisolibacter ginsenosidimutans TaxID=661481 RepID=A0A5B8UDW8_9BACT|nr:TonB-dependent receptor [Flavisolibacter ginsenosidimutans]QEC54764.1 TonB-dependent receptor [Flavisolibacter ginsenosidimutans]